MTTPTPLAETIARVATEVTDEIAAYRRLRGAGVEVSQPTVMNFLIDDIRLLLACARRCEAIDAVIDGSVDLAALRQAGWLTKAAATFCLDAAAESKLLRSERDEYKGLWETALEQHKIAVQQADEYQAERDAMAKRVGELQADNERYGDRVLELKRENERLTAESARLRAENERLAETAKELLDIRERLQLKAEARAFVAEESLRAAQDRVRELEAKLSVLARHYGDFQADADDEGASIGAIDDMLGHVETAIDGIPITDPTQGVGTQPWDFGGSPDLQDAIDRVESRPACVPADCRHYIQLPSGLWAWVGGLCVRIERPDGDTGGWEVLRSGLPYGERSDAFRAAVTEPDFLAARALGVRVLGWAK